MAAFFNKLPGEIRNKIYEMVFSPDEEVDLANPSPPSKALVMSCQQAYVETNQLYKSAYRKYWSTDKCRLTRVCKPHKPRPRLLQQITPARIIDLDHVNHLAITYHFISVFTLEMLDKRGIWTKNPAKGHYCVIRKGSAMSRTFSFGVDGPREAAELEVSRTGTLPSITEQLKQMTVGS